MRSSGFSLQEEFMETILISPSANANDYEVYPAIAVLCFCFQWLSVAMQRSKVKDFGLTLSFQRQHVAQNH
jgi:hypothetical protein